MSSQLLKVRMAELQPELLQLLLISAARQRTRKKNVSTASLNWKSAFKILYFV